MCKKRVFYCRFLSKDACMLFQSTSAQMTQPQHEQESRQAYPYTNSYIKKCNPFPPPSTTNLHVEKTPSLKASFPTQPSTPPSSLPTPHLNLPTPTAPRKQNQGQRFPLQHAQEKRRRKRKVNAMLKPHPSFLSHTCTYKMPKRQTRKKKQKKNPFAHSCLLTP